MGILNLVLFSSFNHDSGESQSNQKNKIKLKQDADFKKIIRFWRWLFEFALHSENQFYHVPMESTYAPCRCLISLSSKRFHT